MITDNSISKQTSKDLAFACILYRNNLFSMFSMFNTWENVWEPALWSRIVPSTLIVSTRTNANSIRHLSSMRSCRAATATWYKKNLASQFIEELAGVPGVARETPISRHSSRPVTVTRETSPSPVTRPSRHPSRHPHPSPSPVTRHRHRPVTRPVNPLYAVIFDRWGRCYKWKLFTTVAYTTCVIFSKSPRLRGTPYWIVGHKPTPLCHPQGKWLSIPKIWSRSCKPFGRPFEIHRHTDTHTHKSSLID